MNRFRKKSDAKQQQQASPPQQSLPGPHSASSLRNGSLLSKTSTASFTSGGGYDASDSASFSPNTSADNIHFPALPPESNFRTSLILPDLSRRFTLLRNNTGSPATLDALRSRFAEQRARGSANQISEEEEDMVLASLKRLQPRSTTTTSASKSSDTDGEDSQSTATVSPSKRRYDHNNLFSASGRFRDYSYMRNVHTSNASSSSRSNSTKASIQSHAMDTSSMVSSPPGTPKASDRFSTQTGSNSSMGVPSKQRGENDHQDAEKAPESFSKRASLALEAAIREMEEEAEDEIVMERSTPITRTSPGTHPMNVNESQERFASISGQNNSSYFDVGVAVTSDQINAYSSSSELSSPTSPHAGPMSPQPLYPDAITSPNPTRPGAHPDALQRPETPHRPITPRLPGYIPGMPIPRPITPRDPTFDSDRSHSTTPRANSPAISSINTNFSYPHHAGHSTSGHSSSSYASTIPRRGSITTSGSISSSRMTITHGPRPSPANGSNSAIHSFVGSEDVEQQQRHRGSPSLGPGIPRTASPGFNLSRSGSLASHDGQNNNNNDRRRPASPLSSQTQTYQSLEMSARPGTPSNITWVPQPSPSRPTATGTSHRVEPSITSNLMRSGSGTSSFGRTGSSSGHSRGASFGTDIGIHNTIHGELERVKMVSPALPDSPMLDVSSPGQVWDRFQQVQQQQQYHHRQGSSSGDGSVYSSARDDRPSSLDLGSPVLGPTTRPYTPPTAAAAVSGPNTYRSGTPTQQLQQQRRAAKSSSAFSGNTETASRSSDPVTANSTASNRSLKHLSSSSSRPISPFVLNLGGSSSNPFMLSSFANGSRESLESTGSSYHSDSWDSDARKDLALNLFSDVDPLPPAWHSLDKSSAATSPDDEGVTPAAANGDDDVEEIIRRYAGLTKEDFVKIQKKLVDAAVAKSATPDLRERTPSLRRRRPSTSMSANSPIGREISRMASPPPRSQSPASPAKRTDPNVNTPRPMNIVDLTIEPAEPIQPPEVVISPKIVTEPSAPSAEALEQEQVSLRRQKDLAQAIFGSDLSPTNTSFATPGISTPPTPSPPKTPATASQSSPHLPPTPRVFGHDIELAKDVQRRAEAATMALRKSPSNPKLNGAAVSGGSVIIKRKVDPHQISSPTLVSASTSVDTIPLPSPVIPDGVSPNAGSFKLGRFRKFRGTIKGKPAMPSGEEVTPYPLTPGSTPSTPSAGTPVGSINNRSLIDASIVSGSASASEIGRFKVPPPVSVSTPPASAGPGLKGFMARFRKRTGEISPEKERRSPIVSPTATASSAFGATTTFPQYDAPAAPRESHSAPAHKEAFITSPKLPEPETVSVPHAETSQGAATAVEDDSEQANQEAALRQLFAAAGSLGVDQALLQDVLARSPSVGSKSTWSKLTRNNSAVTTSTKSRMGTDSWIPPTVNEESARSPTAGDFVSRPSTSNDDVSPERAISPEGNNDTITKKVAATAPTVRRRPDHLRPPREQTQSPSDPSTAVLRRTIIYPSDFRATLDLTALMRKNSNTPQPQQQPQLPQQQGKGSKRRSVGAASIQSTASRSIHDRVPTPPPPRSPTGRRFSADRSQPMPQLPAVLTGAGQQQQQQGSINLLQPPPLPGALEKSNSAYDSLYDMYVGEVRPAAEPAEAEQQPEHGPAVEVLELANGETIWSIVNGLRDDDAESYYGNRASFASEYSNGNEGVQVFFKEHNRNPSKDSATSYQSKKKGQGKYRPETKVFYSSSAQIGRLIENLSSSMEAGSFNILPQHQQASAGRSHPPSFHSNITGVTDNMNWTVEERLEHMLGSMATAS